MNETATALPPTTAGATDPQNAVPYSDYANPQLLEKIPLTARTILDVGCGAGALGAAYRRRNPNARYLGVDAAPGAILEAAARLSDAVCADIEATPMPFEMPDGLDCIIYGDVLDHLRDPWTLLKTHAAMLAPGGTVLICMANIEHWTLVMRLLNGGFSYDKDGLLDQAHLRWFSAATMAEALRNAGLALVDAVPRPYNPDNAQQFARLLAPVLQALNVDPAAYLRRAGPLQIIWRARKEPPPPMMVNATMLEPLGGVSDVRVVEPLRAIKTDSSVWGGVVAEPEMPAETRDIPKIAVLHRPLLMGGSGLARVRALLEKGYLVVSEFDDHPSFMADRGVDMDQVLTFSAVHAVQTSTPALADYLAAANPETAMFPNAVYELPEVRNFQDLDRLTLFFGALNRDKDWAPLLPGLNEIARAVGQRLRFSVVHDKGFFEALETTEKTFVPTCGYAEYLALLGQADIAFMPLSDGVFNRAKSDLKHIEAASHRVVSLASDVVYGASIQDGKTGLMFRNAMEMRAHLLRILAYPEASRRIADAARAEIAGTRMAAYQAADRIAWYRSLWARRDELNAKLRARVPALFT